MRDQTKIEHSWHLSSLVLNPEKAARATQGRWQIENNLLDQIGATLNEDHYSNHSAAQALAVIKNLCLNLLKTNDDSRRRVKQ